VSQFELSILFHAPVFYNITTDKKLAVDGMLNTINALSHGNSYIQGNFHKIEASEIQKAVRILILLR
jgi:hypothetical protein